MPEPNPYRSPQPQQTNVPLPTKWRGWWGLCSLGMELIAVVLFVLLMITAATNRGSTGLRDSLQLGGFSANGLGVLVAIIGIFADRRPRFLAITGLAVHLVQLVVLCLLLLVAQLFIIHVPG